MSDPIPAVRLDQLPRHAAQRWPDHPAIRDGERVLTFADLDARIDKAAALIAGQVGSGAMVGVTARLTPDFAIIYYAIARSGNVAVTVNPYLQGPPLAHVLRASGMALLFTDADHAERLDTGGIECPAAEGLDQTASVHFTSGTTGFAKGVRLSHRNLTVNAAQVAAGQRLDHSSILLNHLPTYHPMHLNSAVYAGATQVLCPGDDTIAAIAAANEYRATRFFSLPVRLARLVDHPRLAEQRLDTVEAIMSGGSALSPDAATALGAHFGIPVTQGYGLAETSPLTHTDPYEAPRIGSVGTLVPETECRIIDTSSKAEVKPGERGEVQLRGPQVMAGYLDPATPTGIDADGWLSTGDIGYQDADGYLYLVDRLSDVFKCDNFLVSPTEIERLVARHPAVRECVVVGHPDQYSGEVAHCFVVPRDATADLTQIQQGVNKDLAYFQQIRHITAVNAIPRSPNGKIARRDIRAWTRPSSTDKGEPTMVTLVNQLTVTGDVSDFERVSASMSSFMSAQPGYLNHRLLRSLRQPEVFVEIAEWQDAASHMAAVRSDAFQGLVKELGGLVAKPAPGLYEDVKLEH